MIMRLGHTGKFHECADKTAAAAKRIFLYVHCVFVAVCITLYWAVSLFDRQYNIINFDY